MKHNFDKKNSQVSLFSLLNTFSWQDAVICQAGNPCGLKGFLGNFHFYAKPYWWTTSSILSFGWKKEKRDGVMNRFLMYLFSGESHYEDVF